MFLAELLDLDGTVQLARAVQSVPTVLEDRPSPADAMAEARHHLLGAEREARATLQSEGGAALVSAARILGLLARAGVPGNRQRKVISTAGRELFAPVAARTLQRVIAVRRRVADARVAIAPAIVARGPVEARLEQIDAAIVSATAARSAVLFATAVAALGDAFAADLERAVLALRTGDAIPAEAWVAPDGLLTQHVGRCEALIGATHRHERARLDNLVESTLGERLP